MQLDFENKIVRNPVLGATLIWRFCSEYEAAASRKRHASLAEIVLASSLVAHSPTVARLHGLQFDTGLARALDGYPELLIDLQARLQTSTVTCLRALAVAIAAGLVARTDQQAPGQFATRLSALPSAVASEHPSVVDMHHAMKRVAIWIARDGLTPACLRLQVTF
ncbi:MAG: hypothetical protein ABS36_06385 [Acidobacteria bacterium SCN 69-37]|nr:MAG: hypothetical protein ABS36_06385 [Acidobacteria bacterium SCN 69-37]